VFRRIRPGRWTFELSAPDHGDATLTVELSEGADVVREVRFERGTTIEGTLVDERGEPLAEQRLQVTQEGAKRSPLGFTLSGKDGRFRFTGLEPGEYAIRATQHGAVPVTVRAPANGVVVAAQRVLRVTARLRVPAGGEAPPRVRLEQTSADGGGGGQTHKWSDGLVEWRCLPGKRRLTILAEGYAPFERDVELASGAALDLGEILLDVGVDLECRAVDRAGRPVAGATFEIAGQHVMLAQAGADGRFRLRHMPRRPVTLEGRAEGFLPTSVEVDATRGPAPFPFVFPRGGVLAGKLASAGAPDPDVWVAVEALDPATPLPNHAYLQFEPDGRFTFAFSAGRYRVSLKRLKEVLHVQEVSLVEGETTPMEFRVP
jgi:protocatechuate 3,4-dioxygenase beta subunit